MVTSMGAADETYRRHDISAWVTLFAEKGGSTPSTWLQDPEDKEVRWLHKDTTIPSNGHEQGEDWSEVLSTQVAYALGVPAAQVRLCTRNGRRGSLSRNVRPDADDLFEGRFALEECPRVTGYYSHREGLPGRDPSRPEIQRPGHTVANIRLALDTIGAPPGFTGPPTLGAFDVFTGYLVLDALIANRDRHEENWALLLPRLEGRQDRLAPSYDHASSLGYNLMDEARAKLLGDPASLRRWAERGTAYRFEHSKRAVTLVELAVQALKTCDALGRRHWKERVAELDLHQVHEALGTRAIPEMSEVACNFAAAVLDLNLRRLRDAIARA